MSAFLPLDSLNDFVKDYGYWGVGVVIGLESMGLPLPGETILVLAAIYCGAGGDLMIMGVVLAAIAGAIIGDNLGYWIGRRYGYPLVLRYKSWLHLTDGRIKLAQYLFLKHGGAVVFFGRFIALLRIFAAFLAGVNRMDWYRFLFANATGGVIWAAIFGFGGYVFGHLMHEMGRSLGFVAFGLAAAAFVGFGWYMRQREAALIIEAEKALPGPLQP
jgi:membrane protein DedA with SNARE-associated domain